MVKRASDPLDWPPRGEKIDLSKISPKVDLSKLGAGTTKINLPKTKEGKIKLVGQALVAGGGILLIYTTLNPLLIASLAMLGVGTGIVVAMFFVPSSGDR